MPQLSKGTWELTSPPTKVLLFSMFGNSVCRRPHSLHWQSAPMSPWAMSPDMLSLFHICEYTLCIGAASILGNATLFSWYYLPSSSRVIILSVNTRFAEGHSWKWDTSDKRPLSALMVVWLDGQLGILSQFVFPQNYHCCWMLGGELWYSESEFLMFKNLTFHIIGQKIPSRSG